MCFVEQADDIIVDDSRGRNVLQLSACKSKQAENCLYISIAL